MCLQQATLESWLQQHYTRPTRVYVCVGKRGGDPFGPFFLRVYTYELPGKVLEAARSNSSVGL